MRLEAVQTVSKENFTYYPRYRRRTYDESMLRFWWIWAQINKPKHVPLNCDSCHIVLTGYLSPYFKWIFFKILLYMVSHMTEHGQIQVVWHARTLPICRFMNLMVFINSIFIYSFEVVSFYFLLFSYRFIRFVRRIQIKWVFLCFI